MPAVAYWPGHIKPGVSSTLLSSMDLFPTLLRLAGVEAPGDRQYDGKDISDVLFNGSDNGHEVEIDFITA